MFDLFLLQPLCQSLLFPKQPKKLHHLQVN